MKKFLRTVIGCFAIAIIIPIASCEKKTGCTNPLATNYNSKATKDDNSCKILGCTDSIASNYNSHANVNDGSCIYLGFTGQVVFWQEYGGAPATVQIHGLENTISKFYSLNYPTCVSPGCATFTLPEGTYSFTAYSRVKNWSGIVTITYGGCLLWELY